MNRLASELDSNSEALARVKAALANAREALDKPIRPAVSAFEPASTGENPAGRSAVVPAIMIIGMVLILAAALYFRYRAGVSDMEASRLAAVVAAAREENARALQKIKMLEGRLKPSAVPAPHRKFLGIF